MDVTGEETGTNSQTFFKWLQFPLIMLGLSFIVSCFYPFKRDIVIEPFYFPFLLSASVIFLKQVACPSLSNTSWTNFRSSGLHLLLQDGCSNPFQKDFCQPKPHTSVLCPSHLLPRSTLRARVASVVLTQSPPRRAGQHLQPLKDENWWIRHLTFISRSDRHEAHLRRLLRDGVQPQSPSAVTDSIMHPCIGFPSFPVSLLCLEVCFLRSPLNIQLHLSLCLSLCFLGNPGWDNFLAHLALHIAFKSLDTF